MQAEPEPTGHTAPMLASAPIALDSAPFRPPSPRSHKVSATMCGLCGVLGAEDHWTDASARPEAFGDRRATRRQERFARIALANRILGRYGLKLGDFEGQSYVLRSATGRTELVPNLVGMWSAAEKLAGRTCDPLEPDLIAVLERD